MTDIRFPLGMLKEVVLRKHLKNSRSGCFNDIQLAEKMLFVLVVDLPLAYEDVVE